MTMGTADGCFDERRQNNHCSACAGIDGEDQMLDGTKLPHAIADHAAVQGGFLSIFPGLSRAFPRSSLWQRTGIDTPRDGGFQQPGQPIVMNEPCPDSCSQLTGILIS